MESIITALTLGCIYGIMAFGIYITYKILDFPDLTTDGSFPLGGAVAAMVLTKGMHPLLTLGIAVVFGVIAGALTGLIHVKGKVRNLLSGIIMMTALYTINLRITGGKANVPFMVQETIFKNEFTKQIFPEALVPYRNLIISAILVIICKIILDLYMKTKSGYLLRAVGDNEVLVTSLAKDKGYVKIIGLAIANGFIALGGSVLAQDQNFFDVSMGPGAIVIGLASVIIGTNLFRNVPFIKDTTAVIIGAIIYNGVYMLVFNINKETVNMKLITAVLLLIFLIISRERKRKVKRR